MENLCMALFFLVVAWHVPFASAAPQATNAANADAAPENDCRCWAGQGQCRANPGFMEKKCKASCLRQQTFETCAEKLPKLQSRSSELGAQIQRLKADAAKAAVTNGDAARREQKLTSQIAELQARLQKDGGNSNLDEQASVAVCAGEASGADAARIQELTTYVASLEEQLRQKSTEAVVLTPTEKEAAAAVKKVETLKEKIADMDMQLQQKDRERKTEVDQLRVATFHAENAKQEATKQIQALTAQIAQLESRVETKDQDKQAEIEQVKVAAGAAEKVAREKIQALSVQVSDLQGKLQQQADETKADQLRAEELQVQKRDVVAVETIRKLNAQISDLKVRLNRKGDDRQEEIEQLRVKVMRAGVAAQEMQEKTQENEHLRAEAVRAKMGRQADADRIKTLSAKITDLEVTMRQTDAEKQAALEQVKTEASLAEAEKNVTTVKIDELTKKVTAFEAQAQKDANNSKCDDKQQAGVASEALQLRVRELEVELLAQTAAYYQMSDLRGSNATLNAGGADPWFALYEALLNLPSNISQCIVALPANIKHFVRAASGAIITGSANAIVQAWEAIKAEAANAWQATKEEFEATKIKAANAWNATQEGFSEGVEAMKAAAVRAVNAAQEFGNAAARSVEHAVQQPSNQALFALFLMSIALMGWLRCLRSLNARILQKTVSGVQSTPCCERRLQRRALQEAHSMQVLSIIAESGKASGSGTQPTGSSTPTSLVHKVQAAEEATMPKEAAEAAEDKVAAEVVTKQAAGQGHAEVAEPQRPQRQGTRVLAMAALVEAPAQLKATEAFQQQVTALQTAQSLVDAAVASMAMMCQEFQAAEAAKKKAAEEELAAKAAAEKAVKDVLKTAARKAAKEKEAAETAARTVKAAALKLAVELAAAEEVADEVPAPEEEAATEASMLEAGEEAAAKEETAAASSQMALDAAKVVEKDTAEGPPLPTPLTTKTPPIAEVAAAAEKIVEEDIDTKLLAEEANAERATGKAAEEASTMENTKAIEHEPEKTPVEEEKVASEFAVKKEAEGAGTVANRLDHDLIQWLRRSHRFAGFLAYICVPVLLVACVACLHMHGHLNAFYEAVFRLWEVAADQTVTYQKAFGNATAGLALGVATVSITTAPGVKQFLAVCEALKYNSLNAMNHAWMTITVFGNNHLSHLKLMAVCFGSVVAICWLKWFRSLLAFLQLRSCAQHSKIAEDCKVDTSSLPCPVFDMASDHADDDASNAHIEGRTKFARHFRAFACVFLAGLLCTIVIFTDLCSTMVLYAEVLEHGLTRVIDRVTYEIGVFVVAVAANLNAKQLAVWWEQVWSLAGQAVDQSWMVLTIALISCVPCIGGIVAVIAWLKKRKTSPCTIDADIAADTDTDGQADALSEAAPTLTGNVPCPVFDMALDECDDCVLTEGQDENTAALPPREKPSSRSVKRYFRIAGVCCAYLAGVCLVGFVGLVCVACFCLLCAWLHVHGYLDPEPYYQAFQWLSKEVSERYAELLQAVNDSYEDMSTQMQEVIRKSGSEDGWEQIMADLKNALQEVSIQTLGNFIAVCLGIVVVIRCLKRRRSTMASAQFKAEDKEEGSDVAPVAVSAEHAADSVDRGEAPIKKLVMADPKIKVLENAEGLENVHENAGRVPCGPFGLDTDTYVYHTLQA